MRWRELMHALNDVLPYGHPFQRNEDVREP